MGGARTALIQIRIKELRRDGKKSYDRNSNIEVVAITRRLKFLVYSTLARKHHETICSIDLLAIKLTRKAVIYNGQFTKPTYSLHESKRAAFDTVVSRTQCQ